MTKHKIATNYDSTVEQMLQFFSQTLLEGNIFIPFKEYKTFVKYQASNLRSMIGLLLVSVKLKGWENFLSKVEVWKFFPGPREPPGKFIYTNDSGGKIWH